MTDAAVKGVRVAIAGGGLAGLAAGCALAELGLKVTLHERRPYVGGRASSYEHPGTNETIDNCQHVLLGCCTNLIDFYRRIGVEQKIRWYDRLVFLEPGGRESVIQPSSLPAPLHSAPSFLRARCLGMGDKLAIARAMASLARPVNDAGGESFLSWLEKHGQPTRAIERFWKPVLVSALNEDLERVSVHYAAQVFRESFLNSKQAGRMGVPTVALSELYDAAGDYIRARGGEVRLRSSIQRFCPQPDGVGLATADGQSLTADYLLLAVPFNAISSMLPPGSEAEPLRQSANAMESSPITGIHLWFDQRITDLDHAVLLDRTIQWMFHKSQLLGEGRAGASYVELVVSSSKTLVEKSKNEIVDLAVRELAEFFPAVKRAALVKSAVVKEVHATWSPAPGVDARRPAPLTPWPRVFLSGDWIATGWPATMEGAVRAGNLAAETLARAAGVRRPQFVVPDLPAGGLMRLLPKRVLRAD
jgi:squalene-associated FAD-dependent desaturase